MALPAQTQSSRFAYDAYLAEFKAYRDEWMILLQQREQMLFLSLVITGGLFSFYFTGTAQTEQSYHRFLSMYLVVPLCMLTGTRWIEQGWRIRHIEAYIAEVVAVRMNGLVKQMAHTEEAALGVFPVLTGIQAGHSSFSKLGAIPGLLGFIHRIVYSGCFVAPGVLSQTLILDRASGRGWARLSQVHFPFFYWLNWIMLAGCLCLPVLRARGARFFKPHPGLP